METNNQIQNQGKEVIAEFAKHKKSIKIIVALLLACFIGYLVFSPGKQYTPEEKIENQFSQLNGKHNKSVIAIKEKMNDPSSFEHVQTKYWVMDDHIKVLTTFRGTNALGAVVAQTALTNVSKEDGTVNLLEFQ